MIDELRSVYGPVRAGDVNQLSPLALAYVGDTVFDLYVRAMLLERTPCPPHKLHLLSAKRVCAAGQAAAYQRIEPLLTEEEREIWKRGRNAHCGTMPKNASAADYHAATGLECLVGKLFLSGNDARLSELMGYMLESEEAK